MDSPVTPGGTPFFHNLQQRFRKSSNASSIAVEPPSSPLIPRRRSDATKSAKIFLQSNVRDDWEFPGLLGQDNDSITARDPLTYRPRADSLSDVETDAQTNKRRSRSDPYKFESPEAVANVVAERRLKRRRLFEEEQEWNEGLRTWAQQRDAWTSAVSHNPSESRPQPASRTVHNAPKDPASIAHGRTTSASTNGSSSNLYDSPLSTTDTSSPDSTRSSVNSATIKPTTTTDTEPDVVSPELGPWLPVYPPLLSHEPTPVARITPASYPTIYSKVVVQSLTPNVPIPLTDMVSALVAGWKAEGAWPPPGSTPNPQDLKTGKRSSAFSIWRREKQGEGPTKADPASLAVPKGRVRRISSAMKRALSGNVAPASPPLEKADELDSLGLEFHEQEDPGSMEGNIELNKGLLDELK